MARPKADLLTKSVKIHTIQQAMLDALIEKWGFVSESEVMRQAITAFYRKYEPEYLQPTVTEKEKIKELNKEEKFEKMPDEEFVTEHLKGLVFTDPETQKTYGVVHAVANFVKPILLTEIKEWAKRNPKDVSFHLATLQTKNLLEYTRNNAEILEGKGIALPDEILNSEWGPAGEVN